MKTTSTTTMINRTNMDTKGGIIMKNTKTMTMKTIAASLAALSIMSTISMAVRAEEADLTADTTETTAITDITAAEEIPAEGTETTETPAAEETPAEEEVPAEEIAALEELNNKFTITFDSNGGTAVESIAAAAGTEIVAPAAPRRPGHIFTGWDAELPAAMPEENLIFTAQWREASPDEILEGDYTITFETDGGTAIEPMTVHSGTPIPALPAPYKYGCTFLGWDIALPETMPAEDFTLTARYTEENTYDAYDEGDIANDVTIGDYGVDMADAAFDTVADLVPGGKILFAPFKTFFHSQVDGENPMLTMDQKLDKMNTKLTEIDNKLQNLDSKVDTNTAWLGDKVDSAVNMSELRKNFQDLSPLVRDLNRDVMAKETDPKLNKYQKMLAIAKLTDSDTYKDVSRCVFKIQCALDGTNGNVYNAFFDTLYDTAALNRMTSREAYNDAKAVADDLVQQYVYAALLMSECQAATHAIENFGEQERKELSAAEITALDTFDSYRHSFDDQDPYKAMVACATGYVNFKKAHDNPIFIFMTKRPARTVKLSNEEMWESGCIQDEESTGHVKDLVADAKKNAFSFDEIKQIAEYVRKNYPGTSLMDYFKMVGVDYTRRFIDNQGLGINIDSTSYPTYVIVGDSKDTSKKDNNKSWNAYVCGETWEDHTVTVPVIKITDPSCSVTNITIKTYREYSGYDYGIRVFHDLYNYKYPAHSYLHVTNIG